jgi:uncharacterized protein (TIGR03435 family)
MFSANRRKLRTARMTVAVMAMLVRIVIDRTGVTEKFDFHLEYAPEAADSGGDEVVPSIFAALGEIGLKLEPAKGLREFVVIDHIERPSGN